MVADLRIKFGRSAVEPGVKEARVITNTQYREYFTVQKLSFTTSKEDEVIKPLFYYHNVKGFLEAVAQQRERVVEDCTLKVGGDTGKVFTQLLVSMYVEDPDPIENKLIKQRSKEDGICGGQKFVETGQRMILLLAWCKGVQQNRENLENIFDHVCIQKHRFKLTGDYHFAMSCFALMDWSSLHPCLYCRRSRVKGVWEEAPGGDDMLHTFGDIELRTLVRRERGSVYCSAETALAKSCIGMVLVWGEGDESNTIVLDKMPPPTVYSLLGLNTVLRPYLENVWDGNLNADLKSELGLVPHSYHGKDEDLEGHQYAKFSDN